MPEFFNTALTNGPAIPPAETAARLVLAFLFGVTIAAIYRWTRRVRIPGSSFPMTLVLLSVLIAMVTQVIGDNVARAFSLVGALSIVRFRTVVRDTQDTAYVILAVIVGMAVGARSLYVAIIGIGVVALAEVLYLTGVRFSRPAPPELVLRIRAGGDQDIDALIHASLGDALASSELLSMGTVKQGDGMEGSYRMVPRQGLSIPDLIRMVSVMPGVQSVQVVRRGFEED